MSQLIRQEELVFSLLDIRQGWGSRGELAFCSIHIFNWLDMAHPH